MYALVKENLRMRDAYGTKLVHRNRLTIIIRNYDACIEAHFVLLAINLLSVVNSNLYERKWCVKIHKTGTQSRKSDLKESEAEESGRDCSVKLKFICHVIEIAFSKL